MFRSLGLQLSSSVNGATCLVGFPLRVTGIVLAKDLASCLAHRRGSLKPLTTFTSFASVTSSESFDGEGTDHRD